MDALITGGAGFIGSNLVHHALATHLRSARRRRQADLRRKPAQSRAARSTGSARRVRARRHRGRGRDGAACSPSTGRDAVLNLAAETHVDRSIDSPRPFIDTNIVGTFVLLEAARRIRGGLRRRDARRRSASCTCRPTRSTARSGRPALFSEETPYAPNSPYAASKAAADHLVRVVLPHLRPADAHHELLEQLRAVPVSREADSADDPERARRPAAADLRRRRQRPRLAARRRSLRRPPAGAAQGAAGREVQYRRRQRADQSRDRRSHLRRARRAAPAAANPALGGARAIARCKTFVPDRPGHDRRYAIDATKIRRELGWTPRAHVRDGPARDRATGISTHRDWCERSRPGATIASDWARR